MSESRNESGDVVEAVEGLTDMLGSVLNLLAARLPTREERQAEEERRAWDMYFAHRRQHRDRTTAVLEANEMLEERRKRFGAETAEDMVLVGRGVLERAVDAVLDARAAGQYDDIVRACRAAMSAPQAGGAGKEADASPASSGGKRCRGCGSRFYATEANEAECNDCANE